MKVAQWSNKPITKDTASTDILALYAEYNGVPITYRHVRRLNGAYVWDLVVGDLPTFTTTITDTRRRCQDDTLLSYACEVTKDQP